MARRRIAILYPTDPAGSVPSGIDSIIKGILKESPDDLEYTLFGATSDPGRFPLWSENRIGLGRREIRFVPLATADASAVRSRIPLTGRHMWGLWRSSRKGLLEPFDVLDFHRIEPLVLFRSDPRPKNVVIHQDMSELRERNSDIMWRHAPWLYDALESRLLAAVDTLFTVRRSAAVRYAALRPTRVDRTHFMPTWADTDVFRPATPRHRERLRAHLLASMRAPERSTLLVFVGRLDGQKDPLLLLRAFHEACRRHDGLRLLIVGGGALQKEVEDEIRALGLSGSVSMLGVQPAARICEVLQASDLFVMSSAYEGMPVAVLEALATGLPVVSTAVGEIPQFIQDGRNGFIAARRSPGALAAAICAALPVLPSLRGEPCVSSVAPYSAREILGRLYDLHRSQSTQ
jgi:glycosyltransferase involved in cell wall biosynthesis